jgi:hypothetical protein
VVAPPAISTFWLSAAFRACSSADSIPSVTKVKVVPHHVGAGVRMHVGEDLLVALPPWLVGLKHPSRQRTGTGAERAFEVLVRASGEPVEGNGEVCGNDTHIHVDVDDHKNSSDGA